MVEVRQCSKCQQPAAVLVMAWEINGNPDFNEKEREWRCQQCGAWAVQKPKSAVIAYWVVGVLLLPTCIGLPFLFLAWRQSTFDKRVPKVPNAPEPRLRYPGGAPRRTCGHCGGIAKTVAITRHVHRGLPTGTDYEYECGQCKKAFTTENVLGHVFSAFSAALLGGVGAAFLVSANEPLWRWGAGLALAGGAVFMSVQNLLRLVNRSKHQVLEEHVL